MKLLQTTLALQLLILGLLLPAFGAAKAYECAPTRPDAQGPFYREGAPVRSEIGEGYLLMGEVKSTSDCSPITSARIEIWMTGPDGRYDDRWRATTFSRDDGRYYFQSHFPGPYGSRPPISTSSSMLPASGNW